MELKLVYFSTANYFLCLLWKGHNIFQKLNADEYRQVISYIKHSILSTDLAVNFRWVHRARSRALNLFISVNVLRQKFVPDNVIRKTFQNNVCRCRGFATFYGFFWFFIFFIGSKKRFYFSLCKRHVSLPDARDLDRATSHAQKRVRELHFHEFAIQSLYLKSAFNVG